MSDTGTTRRRGLFKKLAVVLFIAAIVFAGIRYFSAFQQLLRQSMNEQLVVLPIHMT